jgi:uncharacterized protein (DUF608 family)
MEYRALFPAEVQPSTWARFAADGYSEPVSGVVYSSENPPCCGVPIGGLATGCVDLDARGIWGWSSLWNPIGPHGTASHMRIPRRLPSVHPVLGFSTGGSTWVLASAETIRGGFLDWCTEPHSRPREGKAYAQDRIPCPNLEQVKCAKAIRMWGHYPVADFQYETDAPVAVGMRAWAPFLPGDATTSNIPGALFEVRLRNISAEARTGTLAFSFPGPDPDEARAAEVNRIDVREGFRGMLVSSDAGVNYTLAVAGGADAHFGAGLHLTPTAWSRIADELPKPRFREDRGIRLYRDASCSASVTFSLAAGEETTVRFILAWYAPVREAITRTWPGTDVVSEGTLRFRWKGAAGEGDTHHYTHMYATRYGSSLDAARRLDAEHAGLLRRVLAWQAAVYAEDGVPGWLADCLVNGLSVIAETGHWAQARPPLGDWAWPGGLFALDESPRGCPHMACIPCDWYGNLPIVFFFPELARSTLRAFRQYQTDEGEIPFALGRIDLPDFAVPEYYWQVSLNGYCYIDMVDRLWQATGDASVPVEFWESVKRCTEYTMGLSGARAPAIRMPDRGGMEWFEFGEWSGMTSHAGGLRLAGLLMTERMAKAVGDDAFARRCRQWFEEGSAAMEGELWAGSYYLNYLDPEAGRRSDDVMAYQFDGDWAARFHGFPGVFKPDRVKKTLETIRRCNMALTPDIGAANFARPDGKPLPTDSKVAFYGQYSMFTPELLLLAYTYIQAGDRATGLALAEKFMANIFLKQRHPWDQPNIVDGKSGARWFGTDYSQNMMIWAFPAALAGQDIAAACAGGNLVRRMIDAAGGAANG